MKISFRKKVLKFLFGNKSDLGSETREVEFETGQSFAEANGMGFIEVSAKSGTNVDQSFQILAESLSKKFPKKVLENLDAGTTTETLESTETSKSPLELPLDWDKLKLCGPFKCCQIQ